LSVKTANKPLQLGSPGKSLLFAIVVLQKDTEQNKGQTEEEKVFGNFTKSP
jgi:hypothetical protein